MYAAASPYEMDCETLMFDITIDGRNVTSKLLRKANYHTVKAILCEPSPKHSFYELFGRSPAGKFGDTYETPLGALIFSGTTYTY